MPFTHGVLAFSRDHRTELWACQDSSSCPYRIEKGGHEIAGGRFRCLAFETPEAVVELLLGTLAHAGDMSLLRGVLSKDSRVQRGMSDNQVIKRVAELVVSHRLCLVTEGGELQTRSAASSGAAPLRRAVSVTPSRLVERAPSPAPAATPATSELSDDVDQAVQAAALEEAAELGTPLCEVCEKAAPSSTT